jgi:hypothetical protein
MRTLNVSMRGTHNNYQTSVSLVVKQNGHSFSVKDMAKFYFVDETQDPFFFLLKTRRISVPLSGSKGRRCHDLQPFVLLKAGRFIGPGMEVGPSLPDSGGADRKKILC